MTFTPEFSVAALSPPEGRTERRVNDELMRATLELVELRNSAIRTGDRDALDGTYLGLDSRDYSLQRDDHERTSYYDWYINRIERGMGADIMKIHVIPIYDLGSLPYKYNANWTIDQPEFELQIETIKNCTSWFIRRETLKGGELRVILPNFSDAPWKAPVLETRGDLVEFNAHTFAKTLAERIGHEFCTWSVYLNGLAKIRAFALSVDPYYGNIHLCLLTDKENFAESGDSKWSLSDWRFYNFTKWPYTDELCETISNYVSDKTPDHTHPKFNYWIQPKEDFDVLLACAKALHEPEFVRNLERFDLTADFKTGVFHGHDERCECNFADDENQDLSVLLKQ
jgi:hypothetical protein